MHCSVD
jgi:hypothetical protein